MASKFVPLIRAENNELFDVPTEKAAEEISSGIYRRPTAEELGALHSEELNHVPQGPLKAEVGGVDVGSSVAGASSFADVATLGAATPVAALLSGVSTTAVAGGLKLAQLLGAKPPHGFEQLASQPLLDTFKKQTTGTYEGIRELQNEHFGISLLSGFGAGALPAAGEALAAKLPGTYSTLARNQVLKQAPSATTIPSYAQAARKLGATGNVVSFLLQEAEANAPYVLNEHLADAALTDKGFQGEAAAHEWLVGTAASAGLKGTLNLIFRPKIKGQFFGSSAEVEAAAKEAGVSPAELAGQAYEKHLQREPGTKLSKLELGTLEENGFTQKEIKNAVKQRPFDNKFENRAQEVVYHLRTATDSNGKNIYDVNSAQKRAANFSEKKDNISTYLSDYRKKTTFQNTESGVLPDSEALIGDLENNVIRPLEKSSFSSDREVAGKLNKFITPLKSLKSKEQQRNAVNLISDLQSASDDFLAPVQSQYENASTWVGIAHEEMNALRNAIEKNNPAAIKSRLDRLEHIAHGMDQFSGIDNRGVISSTVQSVRYLTEAAKSKSWKQHEFIYDAYDQLSQLQEHLKDRVEPIAANNVEKISQPIHALNTALESLKVAVKNGTYEEISNVSKSMNNLLKEIATNPDTEIKSLAPLVSQIDDTISRMRKESISHQTWRGIANNLLVQEKKATKSINGASLLLDGAVDEYRKIRRTVDVHLGRYYQKAGIPVEYGRINNYDDLVKHSRIAIENSESTLKAALKEQSGELSDVNGAKSLAEKHGLTEPFKATAKGFSDFLLPQTLSKDTLHYLYLLEHGASGSSAAHVGSVYNFARSLFNGKNKGATAQIGKAGNKIVNTLFGTSTPQEIYIKIDQMTPQQAQDAIKRSGMNLPSEESIAAQAVVSKALSYLQETKPGVTIDENSLFPIQTARNPTPSQMSAYAERIKGALNPNDTLSLIVDGNISKERAEAFKTIYPRTAQVALQTVSQMGLIRQKALPYRVLMNLQKISDAPLTVSSRPESIQRIQAAYAPDNAQAAQGQAQEQHKRQGHPPISQAGRLDLGKAQQTVGQRLSNQNR